MPMYNPYRREQALKNQGIWLGHDATTGGDAHISLKDLKTHCQILGPTGTGKTFFLFLLFKALTMLPRATIILLDPKGGLYERAVTYAMSAGLTHRLVLFDPQNQEVVCGYNPARPNSLPLGAHAKLIREGIEAGWGQSALDFAMTPQLHRLLFLALYAVRELELTLVEALEILRPASRVRKALLPRLRDPHIKGALQYFDSLDPRRQEELAASSLARLESFCLDRQVRHIFTPQQRTLRLEDVLRGHKILCVNLAKGRPLRRDDVFLIGRFLVNDLVNTVFERGIVPHPDPVFLIADEVQNFATPDLCDALDEGRELGLHCILAHQFLAQLKEEERSGYLYHSVMNDCRTRVVFGGLAPEDLDVIVPRMFLGELDSWKVKDEISLPVFAPRESTRLIQTRGHAHSHGRGISYPHLETEGEADTATSGLSESISYGTTESESQAATIGTTRGVSQGWGVSESESQAATTGTSTGSSLTRGTSETHTDSWADSQATSEQWAETEGQGEGSSTGSTESVSSGRSGARDFGLAIDDDDNWTRSYHTTRGWNTQQGSGRTSAESASSFSSQSRGGSTSDASTVGGAVARSTSASVGEQHATSESTTDGTTSGTSAEVGFNSSVSASQTAGTTKGRSQTAERSSSVSRGTTTSSSTARGETPSFSEEESESSSETIAPFMEYHREDIISSRTFLSLEEQKLLLAQRLEAQPTGHCVVKLPERRPVFLKVAHIESPWISRTKQTRARERIWAGNPYYSTAEEIDREEEARRQRISHPQVTTAEVVRPDGGVEPPTFRHRKKNS